MIDFFQAVFTLGSLWFFAVSGLWFIILIALVENEKTVTSAITTILYFLFLQFFVQVNVVKFVFEHPLKSLIIVSSYFALGFIWSFVKWAIFVNKKAIEYKKKRMDFLEKNDIKLVTVDTPIPTILREKWQRQIGFGYEKPKLEQSIKTVSNWVIYWPTSLIWSLLNDFIKKTVNIVIFRIRSLYNLITANAFKSISDSDFEE